MKREYSRLLIALSLLSLTSRSNTPESGGNSILFGHEQVMIDFTNREIPAEPVPLFPEEKQA